MSGSSESLPAPPKYELAPRPPPTPLPPPPPTQLPPPLAAAGGEGQSLLGECWEALHAPPAAAAAAASAATTSTASAAAYEISQERPSWAAAAV